MEIHSNSQSSQNPPLDDLGSISSYYKPVSTKNRQHYTEMHSNSQNSYNKMSLSDGKESIGSHYKLGLTSIKVVVDFGTPHS
ncbi:7593_t:CDS:2, partial [Cetraspora pellucida]